MSCEEIDEQYDDYRKNIDIIKSTSHMTINYTKIKLVNSSYNKYRPVMCLNDCVPPLLKVQ